MRHLPLLPRLRSRIALAALVTALALAAPSPHGATARAGEHAPFAARHGLDLAGAAATSWSADAVLVYVENDDPVDDYGASSRWGYLFHSPSRGASRVYSVRAGKILVAEDLDMKFTAAPLPSGWIDSAQAFAIAEREGGYQFRTRHRGQLATMLLMRGAFSDEDPDATRWAVIYTSPDAPSLFLVIDAEDGSVRRTWRG